MGLQSVVGMDLCRDDGRLRLYNPASGEYLPDERNTARRATAAEERANAREDEARRLR